MYQIHLIAGLKHLLQIHSPLLGMIMLGNNEQFWNAYWPIVTNRFPKVTDNKLVQSLKQYESIVFVPSPITTEVRLHPLKALLSISSKLLGNTTDDKLLH